jgi:benzoyl-CoA reductase subunit D
MEDGNMMGQGCVLTGLYPEKAASGSLEMALKSANISKGDVHEIGRTGSGKKTTQAAGIAVNEIEAMAVGAHWFFPAARTAVDVGAEEGRTVKIDEGGTVVDFAINEKCAAGAGTFIEAMARALETPLGDMGHLALKSGKEIPLNAQCVVFAESEVVGLIHAKTDKADISRAIHDAMVGRIASMVRQLGVNEDVVLIGGVARNPGYVEFMRRELKLEKICIPDAPEYVGAVGAALVAAGKASQDNA